MKKDKLSDNHMKSAQEFIRSDVYVGKSPENYVDTRVRIYKNLKIKTSMAIPPDPDSVEVAIKKAIANIYMVTLLRAKRSNS